jgi:predicted Zn finger-like uncharacterized protein
MAVNVNCPGCRTSYPVTEDLLGKKIRCKKCQETFTAAAAKSTVAARADERITTRAPAKGGNGRYDDDTEDDAPRRNGNGVAKPMAKRTAQKSGGKGLLVGGIAGGGALLAAGIGLGIWMLKDNSDPGDKPAPTPPPISTGTPVVKDGPSADVTPPTTTGGESKMVTAPAPDAPKDVKVVSQRRPANFTQAVIERVKKCAVLIRVTEEEGLGYGSGWFAEKHGDEVYIVTNSHVVGMKEPAKPPPEKIEVILNSGTPEERTLEGKLLGLDREEDLAVIRIKGKDLPDPLPIAPSADLQESEKLLILGFPHGKFLEEELRQGLGVRVLTTLKARQTTVAGRIYNNDHSVRYIQVEGGADPGNSGGAAVDTNGHVSAVLVAGDPGSNMRWVIPSEYAIHLLRGRILTVMPGQAVSSGGTIRQPITVRIADPLSRIRSVDADIWVGPKPDEKKGQAIMRPSSDRPPQPQEGDGPRTTVSLAYDPNQQVKLGEAHEAHGEAMLPPLNDNQVYWFQPHYDPKNGKQRWGEAVVLEMGRYPVDAKPANLTMQHKADTGGAVRRVDIETRQVQGSDVTGSNARALKASLTEKTRSVEKNGDAKVRIQYTDLHLSNNDDDTMVRQMLRGAMEAVKGLGAEVTITRDGRFVNPKPDFANVPQGARPILRIFNDQIIEGLEALSLGLPGKDMQPGESWTHDFHPSLSIGRKTQNLLFRVTCTYVGTRMRDGREEAVVELTGKVAKSGAGQGGPGRGGRGVQPPTSGGDLSPGDKADDNDTSAYDEDGNLKKGFYGMLRGAALVDIATGQVTLSRTESDMAGIFDISVRDPQSGREAQLKIHAGSFLEVLLRRALTKDAAKITDPMTLLPNQPIIYKPMVGASVATEDDPPAPNPTGRSTFLAPEMFDKVRKATVLVNVSAADGGAQGSGWFAEPGVVITNCHVVGMLSKTDRPPEKIEVVLDCGLPTQRKLSAKLLVVDREDDLAAIRVEGDNLPEPLTTVTATTLFESQPLNIVGFPQGSSLARRLEGGLGLRDLLTTVKFRPTTVAGRVPKTDQTIKWIQYEGGADHGNSGGPIVDDKGTVRGVLVAGAGGTSMVFGIPSEYATQLIQGYPLEVLPGRAYLDGSVAKQPVTVKFGDPMRRVKKVVLDYWVGDVGNPRKPSDTAPKPGPGDKPRQSVELTYNPETQTATGEFVLPEVPTRRVCFLQPRFVNGTGKELWSRGVAYAPDGPPVERIPAMLALKMKSGTKRGAELTTFTNLHYILFGVDHGLGTPFKVNLSENVLAVNSKTGTATVNLEYQELELDLKKLFPGIGEAPPQLEAMLQQHFKPLLSLIRGLILVVDVTRDGRLRRPQINVARLPFAVQPTMLMFNDQVYKSLQALMFPLPGKQVPYGYTWDFPTDLFIAPRNRNEGAAFQMNFKYVGVRDRGGRREAIIEIGGSLKGNPNAKGMDADDAKEVPAPETPTGTDPMPNSFREQLPTPGMDTASGKKGIYGVAHGYAFIDVNDGFVAEVKLFIDLDIEMKVRDVPTKQDVPVVAGGTMELHLIRRTAQTSK